MVEVELLCCQDNKDKLIVQETCSGLLKFTIASRVIDESCVVYLQEDQAYTLYRNLKEYFVG